MIGPFVHNIDPIFADLKGIYLWWYGLSYALGFLETRLWLNRVRERAGLAVSQTYSLTICIALGILLGGRAVEVVFYEWPYYKDHLLRIPAEWLGGMSTHGVLLGAVVGMWLFCRANGKSFLQIADELAIPGAFLMGMGRIGNFIDGQIVGRVTDVWWAVRFPDAEGFRHPVVLYDGLKNFLIILILLFVWKRKPPRGVVMAHFIFWYGFLRIFVDFFREYRVSWYGLPPGQGFNIFMALAGSAMLIVFSRRGRNNKAEIQSTAVSAPLTRGGELWFRRFVLIALMLFSLTLPSDWTQDIPARYGKRHPGLHYSLLYPRK
jgi:phosphatidylglycerol---prolipoprotein diacylglyceryl transferase